MAKKTKSSFPPDIAAAKARSLTCYVPTSDKWGSSYILQNPDDADMNMLVQLYVHPWVLYDTKTPRIAGWRITAWGDDDTMIGRTFEFESGAHECLIHLLTLPDVTKAYLTSIGFEY